MKKFTNLCFAILSIFCSCQGNIEDVQNSTQFQTTHEATNECNYYWYNGKKIELIVDSTKISLFTTRESLYLKRLKEVNFKKAFLQREAVDNQKHHGLL